LAVAVVAAFGQGDIQVREFEVEIVALCMYGFALSCPAFEMKSVEVRQIFGEKLLHVVFFEPGPGARCFFWPRAW